MGAVIVNNLNGVVISGSFIGCDLSDLPEHTYDATTKADDVVNRIVVKSDSCPINVVAGADELSVRIHGSEKSNKELGISQYVSDGLLHVTTMHSGVVVNSNVVMDVRIPSDFSGNLIFETLSGDINIECVKNKFNDVELQTQSGDIHWNGDLGVKNLKINNVSGKTKFIVNLISDIIVNSRNTSGKTNFELSNVKIADIDARSVTGKTTVDDFSGGKYTISGSFVSVSGKIKIH